MSHLAKEARRDHSRAGRNEGPGDGDRRLQRRAGYVRKDAAGPSEGVGKVGEEPIYGLAKACADPQEVTCVRFGVRAVFVAAPARALSIDSVLVPR